MNEQFTPTTEQVRTGYAIDPEAEYRDPLTNHTARGEREFDRWLTKHDAEVRAAGGDEHHTLDELYEYRMLYNALAANEWAAHGTYPVVKSWRHSDGEECFGGGWFIVVATLPSGQVSNHYAAEHWGLFAVPEVEMPPEYDGHDPAEAARRMHALLSQPTRTAEPPLHHLVRPIESDNVIGVEPPQVEEGDG